MIYTTQNRTKQVVTRISTSLGRPIRSKLTQDNTKQHKKLPKGSKTPLGANVTNEGLARSRPPTYTPHAYPARSGSLASDCGCHRLLQGAFMPPLLIEKAPPDELVAIAHAGQMEPPSQFNPFIPTPNYKNPTN